MFKSFSNKKITFFVILTILITTFIYAPIVEAKGSTTTANAAPIITLGETGSITINENTVGTISLTAKDSNKDLMYWSISTAPTKGTVNLGTATNVRGTSTVAVKYIPEPNYAGSDMFFIVSVKDAKGATDTIKILLTINSVNKISYVALGDSIATGTIYSTTKIDSYVKYFYDYLVTKYATSYVTKLSFATDGDRTNELYNKLGLSTTITGNADLISAVTNADIITLSIGGNNLMQAAKDSSSLGGYNFNYINEAVANQGLTDFRSHWVPIIQKIKTINPDVKLIVTSTFNPYNSTDASLHDKVDSYLSTADNTGLNDLIINNSSVLEYSVANVYKYFDDYYKDNMGSVTYFYPSPSDLWGTLTRNPHPNAAGQNFITNLVKTAFEAMQ